MPFTSGFFKAHKGDRKYNGDQLSEIFDGILKDGIIPSQGQLFAVKSAENGMQITIGTGRAWFDHTWSKNDSTMVLTVENSDAVLSRYDTVVLEVNHEDDVRANSIKIIKGISAADAVKPEIVNTDRIKQYPLAHIYVEAGSTEIKASNIENMIGCEPTVFATGILETASLDDLWSQWKGEWDEWFGNIKGQLSGDIIANLQYQIDILKESLKYLQDMVKIKDVTHTEIITSSGYWKNNQNEAINISVRVFGGGGGSGYNSSSNGSTVTNYGGGGGGHMATWTGSIPSGSQVYVTIGEAGKDATGTNSYPTTGGTTSFGSYVSANGGSYGSDTAGGNGGTGGGGFMYSQSPGTGGTGTYGGGGGGCGGWVRVASSSGDYAYPAGSGGKGGTYGGGGGGGGGVSPSSSYSNTPGAVKPGSGGSSGTYGGSGGSGGSATTTTSGSAGSSGSTGRNTSGSSLDFTGTGAGGTGGSAYAASNSSGSMPYGIGGGGGGGGGYGGRGGNGGTAQQHVQSVFGYTCTTPAGGGGGGYGGNGASASYSMNGSSYYYYGGGGGGYGGSGNGAGGGGYGSGNQGCGSGNVRFASGYPAKSGVCVITYTTRELVVG